MFSSTWVMSISLTQLLLGRDQDGSSGGGACFALHSDDTYGDFRLAAYMVLLSFSNTFITFTIVFPLLGCWLCATWGEEINSDAYRHIVLSDCIL